MGSFEAPMSGSSTNDPKKKTDRRLDRVISDFFERLEGNPIGFLLRHVAQGSDGLKVCFGVAEKDAIHRLSDHCLLNDDLKIMSISFRKRWISSSNM